MEEGKKPSTDLDRNPAKYPVSLDLEKELRADLHPSDTVASAIRKRKRFSFDEVSNIILEGIGDGPIRKAAALEEAARTLKHQGKVELWNYLGGLKSATDASSSISKVWRLQGELSHSIFHKSSTYSLEAFDLSGLTEAQEWLNGKHSSHTLVMSGDRELGKTSTAEAMLSRVCPGGFWFVDDPDDFRELEGQICEGHGLLVDEISLEGFAVNQVKKMMDLEKARRIKCRNSNASLPKGCKRIFCTNSEMKEFYPPIPSAKDKKGVMRRQLFQSVVSDLRVVAAPPSTSIGLELPVSQSQGMDAAWPQQLKALCDDNALSNSFDRLKAAADGLGVAWWCELCDVGQELADAAGLKTLERRRLIAALC